MKKFNYLIAMAIAAFTFTSCEDVPEPFGQPINPNKEEIVIEPTGSGTEADPYNVAKVTEVTKAMADGDVKNDVYTKGYICQIDEIDITGTYGNSTYWISDDAEGKSGKYEVYRGVGLGGQKFNEAGATIIKVGDAVIIKGNIKNFKGTTPEYDSGSIIVELNGVKAGGGGNAETIGTKEAPITVAKALEYINALADNGTTDKEAYVEGTIKQIKTTDENIAKYKNIDYVITDGTNDIIVFRGKNLNNTDFTAAGEINVGDKVVVLGKLTKYVKDSNTTPEIAQGNYIVSLVKGGSSGAETIGTKEAPITVAKALEYINALADNGTTDKEAYVEGTIKQIKTTDENIAKYKNIDYVITDGTNDIIVFRGKNLNNTDFTAAGQINVGDKVVVLGKLTKYVKDGNTTPEIAQGNYLVSLVPAGGGDTPSGDVLNVSFADGQGDFTIDDKDLGGLTFVWKADTKGYMKASAYANNTNNPAESWLVSPAFSLKNATAPVMTFNNACNYVKEGTITDHIKVMVYDGANWAEATIASLPDGKSWTFVDSSVDLKAYAGKENVKVAFKYVSTSAVAPTWEIKTVVIK